MSASQPAHVQHKSRFYRPTRTNADWDVGQFVMCASPFTRRWGVIVGFDVSPRRGEDVIIEWVHAQGRYCLPPWALYSEAEVDEARADGWPCEEVKAEWREDVRRWLQGRRILRWEPQDAAKSPAAAVQSPDAAQDRADGSERSE